MGRPRSGGGGRRSRLAGTNSGSGTDSGSGIAAHHLPQLFERYYRADGKPSQLACFGFIWCAMTEKKVFIFKVAMSAIPLRDAAI